MLESISTDGITEKLRTEINGSVIGAPGYQLYLQDQVQLISEDPYHAHLHVWNSRNYCVDIWVDNLGINFKCTCSNSGSGFFCDHKIAAGLFLREQVRSRITAEWRKILTETLFNLNKPSENKKERPFLLFFSLQQDYFHTWIIKPYILPAKDVLENFGLDKDQLITKKFNNFLEQNSWIANRVKIPKKFLNPDECLNCSESVVSLANLLIRNEMNHPPTFTFSNFRRPSVELLELLANNDISLFTGDLHSPLIKSHPIIKDPGEFRILLTRNDYGVKLQSQIALPMGEVIPINPSLKIISTEPIWLLTDSYLVRLKNNVIFDGINQLLISPEILIPPESETEFLEKFLLPLANQITIEGPELTWEIVHEKPEKQLCLSEEDGQFVIELRFGYGEYNVSYQKEPDQESVQRKISGDWGLVKIIRDIPFENEVFKQTSSTKYGLKFSKKNVFKGNFNLRAGVHQVDFLMYKVPILIKEGYKIFGEKSLVSARVNRHKPSVSFQVSTGIDWFDIKAIISFGEVGVSLQEVRKALRKKAHYVKLTDGSIGEIPVEWLNQYKNLFYLGEQTETGVRFSANQVTIVDQLIAGSQNAKIDDEYKKRIKLLSDFTRIDSMPLPKGFNGDLLPYQKSGYDWLYFLNEYGLGGCLADDMGLGKTIQILIFLQSLYESNKLGNPALIVVPRSLLTNWQREAEKFTPELTTDLYFGSKRKINKSDIDSVNIIFTTYGTMRRDIQKLRKLNFSYVILDESQVIKNPHSQVSKAVRLLNSNYRLVLTGTPVENSTLELWSQFAFLNSGLLGSLDYFKREFVIPIERAGDEEVVKNLRKIVYPFILRRTKTQVAPELPPRLERNIYLEMGSAQRKIYNQTRDYYRKLLIGMIDDQGMERSRMKILEGLLRLRQISLHPRLVNKSFKSGSSKVDLLLDTLYTLNKEGHKALVFSQFVQFLSLIKLELNKQKYSFVYLDGQTKERQKQVDIFQNDENVSFFLISLRAGGVGLNLTAAEYVIHLDPWWNPAVEMQATDRTHRIGQEKPVFVYKFIVKDTIEEKILELQERKRILVDQIISTEENFFKNLTIDDIDVLFR